MKATYFSLPAIALTLMTASAQADTKAVTTLSFTNPVTNGPPVNHTVDALVIDWSTTAMSGAVNQADLTNLSYTLTNGGTLVYQDNAIVNSVVQPIGGAPRTLSDLSFNFDIDSIPLGMGTFDNDVAVVQAGATGLTYNLFSTRPGRLDFSIFLGGSVVGGGQPTVTQNTTHVPEPASLVLLGLCGLALVARRRSRHR